MVGESLGGRHRSSSFNIKVELFSDSNLHLPRLFKHIIGAVPSLDMKRARSRVAKIYIRLAYKSYRWGKKRNRGNLGELYNMSDLNKPWEWPVDAWAKIRNGPQ